MANPSWTFGAAALVMLGALLLLLAGKALGTMRSGARSGTESLPGRRGQVRQTFTADDFQPPFTGQVFVAGELWRAEAQEPLQRGEEVRVTAVRGLTLQVEPVYKPGA